MIADRLENLSKYRTLNKNFDVAFRFLKETDLNFLAIGRHNIERNDIFALVSEYETKLPDQLEWEKHIKYCDIQILLSGEEQIGYTQINDYKITKEYNAEKDILFFNYDGGDFITLKNNSFIIFFPDEAHKPGLISTEKLFVKKLVIKVISE